MNALIPKKLSVAQQKALDREIRSQCVERVEEYELMQDVANVYSTWKKTKYGPKRMKDIYDDSFRLREEIKEYFTYQDGKGRVHEASHEDVAHAMMYELKQAGIDVEAWYNEHRKAFGRLKPVYKGGAVKYE